MKENLTDITILLDRSGSMQDILSGTIEGLNGFVRTQKDGPGKANLTFIQFDGDDPFDVVFEGKDIREVGYLGLNPRGSTPLLDAIARTIKKTEERLANTCKCCKPEKVVIVIYTDGEENASREYRNNYYAIEKMISHQKECHKWQFVFMGTNQDAIANAAKIGIKGSSAITYQNTNLHSNVAFESLSRRMTAMRNMNASEYTASVNSCNFFEAEDYAAQNTNGDT